MVIYFVWQKAANSDLNIYVCLCTLIVVPEETLAERNSKKMSIQLVYFSLPSADGDAEIILYIYDAKVVQLSSNEDDY